MPLLTSPHTPLETGAFLFFCVALVLLNGIFLHDAIKKGPNHMVYVFLATLALAMTGAVWASLVFFHVSY